MLPVINSKRVRKRGKRRKPYKYSTSNNIPWRAIEAQFHGRFRRQSYLRAAWTRLKEDWVVLLLHQESFARASPREVYIPVVSSSSCRYRLLEVKAWHENGKVIWKHTGGTSTSSATHTPNPKIQKLKNCWNTTFL